MPLPRHSRALTLTVDESTSRDRRIGLRSLPLFQRDARGSCFLRPKSKVTGHRTLHFERSTPLWNRRTASRSPLPGLPSHKVTFTREIRFWRFVSDVLPASGSNLRRPQSPRFSKSTTSSVLLTTHLATDASDLPRRVHRFHPPPVGRECEVKTT